MNNNVTTLSEVNNSAQSESYIKEASTFLLKTIWKELGEPVLHSSLKKIRDFLISKIETTTITSDKTTMIDH